MMKLNELENLSHLLAKKVQSQLTQSYYLIDYFDQFK